MLTQEQLAHSLFPLGDSRKADVRREAAARGLPVADKPDSHDICFVADGDTAGWLREKLGDRARHEGDIVDAETGERLGRHEGTYGFTIGQRRGLRLGRPAPDGKPRFVLDIEPVVRHRARSARASVSTSTGSPASGRAGAVPPPIARSRRRVQLRAHGAEHRAASCASDTDGTVEIELLDPAQGIAPGQAAVVYDGTRVVGSATISATSRSAALSG